MVFKLISRFFNFIINISDDLFHRQEEWISSLAGSYDCIVKKKYKPESDGKRRDIWAAIYGMQKWDQTEWQGLKEDIDSMFDNAEDNILSIMSMLYDMGYSTGESTMIVRNLCHNSRITDSVRNELVDLWCNYKLLDGGDDFKGDDTFGDVVNTSKNSLIKQFKGQIYKSCLPINLSIDPLKEVVVEARSKKQQGEIIKTIMEVSEMNSSMNASIEDETIPMKSHRVLSREKHKPEERVKLLA